MSEPPRIGPAELRDIVTDPIELTKGARFADDGLLSHLARHQNRLYADASGSGPAPYKVQITFDEKLGARARCSCFAARSRPFCKHAAALLVSWSRAPDAFAVGEAPPEARGDGPRRREVKRGKTETAAIMRGGVQQVITLVRELALSGVASIGADRPDQVRALGEGLRDQRLRRLSARTLELARLLELAAARESGFDPEAYAELVADLLLTARKIEKHLDGETIEPRHVEELIGKTWTKKDRTPIEGLELVEHTFLTRITPDEYVIRESRFVSTIDGAHYAEKQILPAFLARRTPAKKSHAGRVLEGVSGTTYPGFPPRRLDVAQIASSRPIDARALAAIHDRALPSVAAALAVLAEHRRDLFAPDRLPVTIRVDTVLAEGARMQIVDASDAAIFLPDDRAATERLASVLHGAHLHALIGELALDGALPTLHPLAALVEDDGELDLRGLSGPATEIPRSRRARRAAATTAAGAWALAAREAGLSAAAIALGEVRTELADALAAGLGTLGARRVDPLVARLRELSLAKQAELLAELPGREDPAERIDDLVKLHQVLGIALSRLAGATRVDRATLVTVPTYESVRVRAPAEALAPRAIASAAARGEISRFQAAVLYARHHEAVDPSSLAGDLAAWSDGSATPFVARALAPDPERAIDAARRVLGEQRPISLTAALTAIEVLRSARDERAARALLDVARKHASPAIRAHAQRAIRAIDRARGVPVSSHEAQRELEGDRLRALLASPDRHAREEAAAELALGAHVAAIPELRAALAGDPAPQVRRAAALALGAIGDVGSLDVLVRAVQQRSDDEAAARTAVAALGALGDVRATDALLDALEGGFAPQAVAAAIQGLGSAALGALLARIEASPELGKRRAILGAIEASAPSDLEDAILARLSPPLDPARAAILFAIAKTHAGVAHAIAIRILELAPDLGEAKTAPREDRALRRKLLAAAEE